jgi:hypothetical protein
MKMKIIGIENVPKLYSGLTNEEIDLRGDVLFQGKYHMHIWEDGPSVFTFHNSFKTEQEWFDFPKEMDDIGGYLVERSVYAGSSRKLQQKYIPQHGTFIFVSYSNFLARVYREKEQKILLYTDRPDFAEKHDFNRLEEHSFRYVKWVPKTECINIEHRYNSDYKFDPNRKPVYYKSTDKIIKDEDAFWQGLEQYRESSKQYQVKKKPDSNSENN